VLALLDYGAGNIRSVEKALVAAGADVKRFVTPDGIDEAHGVVLPGVGAFDDCINALHRQNLSAAVKSWINSGRPFLGICVGYQALFDRSEEFNSCALGLSVFPGPVVRFKTTVKEPRLKIPQIGWNQVRVISPDCPLFAGIPDESHFYFVHSFYPQPVDRSIVAGETTYGVPFAAAVCQGNVWATQFHPEKSQGVGIQLLRNFVQFVDSRGGR
jgi:glutamine amidotransferase